MRRATKCAVRGCSRNNGNVWKTSWCLTKADLRRTTVSDGKDFDESAGGPEGWVLVLFVTLKQVQINSIQLLAWRKKIIRKLNQVCWGGEKKNCVVAFGWGLETALWLSFCSEYCKRMTGDGQIANKGNRPLYCHYPMEQENGSKTTLQQIIKLVAKQVSDQLSCWKCGF